MAIRVGMEVTRNNGLSRNWEEEPRTNTWTEVKTGRGMIHWGYYKQAEHLCKSVDTQKNTAISELQVLLVGVQGRGGEGEWENEVTESCIPILLPGTCEGIVISQKDK